MLNICAVDTAPGSVHDFELYKNSNLGIREDIQIIGDKGYQGIQKMHANSLIPFKNSSKKPITELQKVYNSCLSSNRIRIEHVNSYIKRFRILSARFRNARIDMGKKYGSFAEYIIFSMVSLQVYYIVSLQVYYKLL